VIRTNYTIPDRTEIVYRTNVIVHTENWETHDNNKIDKRRKCKKLGLGKKFIHEKRDKTMYVLITRQGCKITELCGWFA
jgi:hypothetical protein